MGKRYRGATLWQAVNSTINALWIPLIESTRRLLEGSAAANQRLAYWWAMDALESRILLSSGSPIITNFVVGDGSDGIGSHSLVSSVTVTVNEVIPATDAGFVMTERGNPGDFGIQVSAPIIAPDGQATYVITADMTTGPTLIYLPASDQFVTDPDFFNGIYDLTLDGQTRSFYSLFGDLNNEGIVTESDVLTGAQDFASGNVPAYLQAPYAQAIVNNSLATYQDSSELQGDMSIDLRPTASFSQTPTNAAIGTATVVSVAATQPLSGTTDTLSYAWQVYDENGQLAGSALTSSPTWSFTPTATGLWSVGVTVNDVTLGLSRTVPEYSFSVAALGSIPQGNGGSSSGSQNLPSVVNVLIDEWSPPPSQISVPVGGIVNVYINEDGALDFQNQYQLSSWGWEPTNPPSNNGFQEINHLPTSINYPYPGPFLWSQATFDAPGIYIAFVQAQLTLCGPPYTQIAIINNSVQLDVTVPGLGPITIQPSNTVPVETPVTLSDDLYCQGSSALTNDPQTAVVNWGDGVTDNATMTNGATVDAISANHIYQAPGIYNGSLVVTDTITGQTQTQKFTENVSSTTIGAIQGHVYESNPPADVATTPPNVALTASLLATVPNLATGIANYSPGDDLLVSAEDSSQMVDNLLEVDNSGNSTAFPSSASGSSSPVVPGIDGKYEPLDLFVVQPQDEGNGFDVGDVFVGNDQPGQIIKITPNGASTVWVTLPTSGTVVSAVQLDPAGIFGGDLLVTTSNGNNLNGVYTGSEVYLIDGHGNYAKLNIPPQYLLTSDLSTGDSTPYIVQSTLSTVSIPDDPNRWGPLANSILISSENDPGQFFDLTLQPTSARTLGSTGMASQIEVTPYSVPIDEASNVWANLSIIPSNENLYLVGNGYATDQGGTFGQGSTSGQIYGISASQLAGMAGEVLLTKPSLLLDSSSLPQYNGSPLAVLSWDQGVGLQITPLTLRSSEAGTDSSLLLPNGYLYQTAFSAMGLGPIPSPTVVVPPDPMVYIDLNNDGQYNSKDPIAIIDPVTGEYTFPNVAPGTYIVRQALAPGWTQTVPSAGFYTVTVTTNQTTGGIDFGSTPTVAPPMQSKAPVITSIPPQSVSVGQSYQYNIQVANPYPNDPLIYDLPQHPAGMSIDLSGPNGPTIVWMAPQAPSLAEIDDALLRVTDPLTGQSVVQAIPVNYAFPSPTHFTATPGGINSINLSWTSVPGATAYWLERSTQADFSDIDTLPGVDHTQWISVGQNFTESNNQIYYTDEDRDSEPTAYFDSHQTYYYRVEAEFDNSESSMTLSEILPPYNPDPPPKYTAPSATAQSQVFSDNSTLAAPVDLTATPALIDDSNSSDETSANQSANAIILDWLPVQDPIYDEEDNVSFQLEYNLFRSQSPTFSTTSASLIDTVPYLSVTNYTDTFNLTPNTTYYYWVQAINITNAPTDITSNLSLAASATTNSGLPTVEPQIMGADANGASPTIDSQGRDPTGLKLSMTYTWTLVSVPSSGAIVTYNQQIIPLGGTFVTDNDHSSIPLNVNDLGSYTVGVQASDTDGLSAFKTVEFTYAQTLHTVLAYPAVAPDSLNTSDFQGTETAPEVAPGATELFNVVAYDQSIGGSQPELMPITESDVTCWLTQNQSDGQVVVSEQPDEAGQEQICLIYSAGDIAGTNVNDILTIQVTVPGENAVAEESIDINVNSLSQLSQPASVTVQALSDNQVQLSWDAVAGATGYMLLRQGSDGSEVVLPGEGDVDPSSGLVDILYTDANNPYYDASLTPNVKYTYQVEAVDNNYDVSLPSDPVTATTWAAPQPPVNFNAIPLSNYSIQLSWDATQPDNPNISGWDILRSSTEDGSYSLVATQTTAALFVDQNLLTANTQYWYEIEALQYGLDGSVQESAPSTPISATTLNGPPAPANVLGGYAGEGRMGLQWTAVNYPDLLGYDIYRGTAMNFPLNAQTKIGSAPTDQPFYTDDGVSPNQIYYYSVVAVADDGNGGELDSPPGAAPPVNTAAEVQIPTAPSALNATVNSDQSVTLNWNDNSVNEAGFDIYRSTNGSTWTWIGQVTQDAVSFTDTHPGTGTFDYKVAAYSFSDNANTGSYAPASTVISSGYSTLLGVAVTSGQGPGMPTHVTASATDTQVSLSWMAPTGSPAAATYTIYRQMIVNTTNNIDGPPALIVSGLTSATYIDQTISSNATYVYEVEAVSSQGAPSLPAVSSNITTNTATTDSLYLAIAGINPAAPATTEQDTGWNESIPAPITASTEILGAVVERNIGALFSWTLTLVPASTSGALSATPITLTTSDSPIGSLFDSGMLFTLDPSLYPAGAYFLKLTANDASSGSQSFIDSTPLSLSGSGELGKLTLPVTDLTVNVPGRQPIVIQRDYNSSQVSAASDLGPGWNFDTAVAQISTTTAANSSEQMTLPFGGLVYITLPDGEQHVFQFLPVPSNYEQNNSSGGLSTDPLDTTDYEADSTMYSAQFICVDGSNAQLTVPNPDTGLSGGSFLSRDPDSDNINDFVWFNNGGTDAYNPSNAAFGGTFTLTEPDGSQYTINSATGHINSWADANGNITTYTSSTIESGDTTVTFVPNSSGNITLVSVSVDSNSSDDLDVYYTYQNGLLSTVSVPQTGTPVIAPTTITAYTYHYTSNLLTSITNGVGVNVLTANYDPITGDLTSLVNATGGSAGVQNGSSASVSDSQVVSTASAGATATAPAIEGSTTEDVYDDHGSVTREIQALLDANGNVSEYIVTCRDYTYGTLDPDDDLATGQTSDNQILSETDFQPFTITGSDPTDLRYTQAANQISQQISYFTSITATFPGDVGQISSETTYGPNGLPSTQSFSGYVNGKPTDTWNAAGNETVNTYDLTPNANGLPNGDLLSTTVDFNTPDAITTVYTYTLASGSLPGGLVLTTSQVQADGTSELLSSNSYTTTGLLQTATQYTYGVNGTSSLTHTYTYDDYGNQVRDSYINPVDGNTVETDTQYDASGRVIGITTDKVTSSTGTILESGIITATHYNAAGQVDWTEDEYGQITHNYYDANGNLVETLNPSGTETLTAYDAMNRPYLTTDPFLPGGSQPVVGTLSLYDALGRATGSEQVTNLDIQVNTITLPAVVTVLSLGNEVSSTSTSYNADGSMLSQTSAAGLTTSSTYYPNGEQETATEINVPVWNPLTGQNQTASVTHTYVYDSSGNQISDSYPWIDPYNPSDVETVQTDTAYDAMGRVTSVTTDKVTSSTGGIIEPGTVTVTDYNARGQVDWTENEYGQKTYDYYDLNGNLVETINANGTETRTAYDSMNEPYLTTNPFAPGAGDSMPTGVVGTLTTYDALGQVTATEQLSGVNIQVAIDPQSALATVISVNDGTDLNSTSTTYNFDGTVATTTNDAGLVTSYTYYSNDALEETATQMNAPVWNASTGQTATENLITTYTYDAFGRESTMKDPLGNVTAYAYNAQGELTTTTFANGTSTVDGYDALGNKISQADQAGNITTYKYDSLGNLIEVDSPAVGGVTPKTTYTYDAYGDELSQTDANGNTTRFTYDARGEKTSQTLPDKEMQTWTYDAFGNITLHQYYGINNYVQPIATIQDMYNTSNDSTAGKLLHEYRYYDNAASAVDLGAATPFAGGATAFSEETDYTYYTYGPSMGQLMSVVDYSNATAGAPPAGLPPSILLTAEQSPTGSAITLYWTEEVSPSEGPGAGGGYVSDPSFDWATLGQSSQGQSEVALLSPQALQMAWGGSSPAGDWGLVGMSFGGGNTNIYEADYKFIDSAFIYDPTSSQDENAEIAGWDGGGEGLSAADPQRQISVALAGGDTSSTLSGTYETSYQYDPITGQVSSLTTPIGTIEYDYDPATGLMSSVLTYAVNGTTPENDTGYTYDSLGQLTNVTQYVLNGQIEASHPVTVYSYDADGNLSSESDPNGMVTTYSYDSLDRLTGETVTDNGHTIFQQAYTLDHDGQKTQVIEERWTTAGAVQSTTTTNWTYDADGRLASEAMTSSIGNDNYTDTFSYDLVGNRIKEVQTGAGNGGAYTIQYAYDGDDQLTDQSGDGGYIDFTYDALGNMSSQSNSSTGEIDVYSYDLRNRMIQETAFLAVAPYITMTNYGYDSNGVMASEVVNVGSASDDYTTMTVQSATYYLNDPDNSTGYTKAIQEVTTGGALVRSYVLGLGVIAQSDATNGTLYLLTDGHGSTRAVVNNSGVIEQTYDYDAFGDALGFDASAAMTVWLFGGDGTYDASTGWTYQLARWRDGFFFTQSDMPGYSNNYQPLTLNKYLYAGADPVDNWDPSGHDSLVELEVTEDIGEELDDVDVGSSYSALTKATAVALTVGIISGGGLVFLQNGSPTTLGYDLAMQALLQQHQTAVGTAYGQAVQTAVATGKYTKQQVQNMPVFFVFKTGAGATPQIWQNDANAMAGKGTKGGASAPDVVNYFPGINATNRPAALGWARSVGIVAGNGQSLDEYPFASTVEGGVTPWLSVAPVAAGEQSAQGLNLSAFYGTQGFKPFTFLVVLVP